MKISLFTKKAFFENTFIGDFPEPEPKKCNCFGSGQKGRLRLRAALAPAPQHWRDINFWYIYLFIYLLVQELELYDNQITRIENLDGLVNLKMLDISHNRLRSGVCGALFLVLCSLFTVYSFLFIDPCFLFIVSRFLYLVPCALYLVLLTNILTILPAEF